MLLGLARKGTVGAALVAVALGLNGCLKSDETFTLYPDGSGKVEVKTTLLGILSQVVRMGSQGGNPFLPPHGEGREGTPPAFEKPDPFAFLKKGVKGKIYWTDLRAEDGPAGEYILSGVGYFENLNEIEIERGSLSFRRDEAAGGYVFEMRQDLASALSGGIPGMPGLPGMPGDESGSGEKLTPEQEAQRAQLEQMARSMLAGFEMKLTVIMPGVVKAAEGINPGEGRKAVWHLSENDLMAIAQKKKEPPKSFRVVCGEPERIDEELSAFRRALAAAKEQAAREKAEAKAAKQAAGESKSEGAKPEQPKPPGEPKRPEGGREF